MMQTAGRRPSAEVLALAERRPGDWPPLVAAALKANPLSTDQARRLLGLAESYPGPAASLIRGLLRQVEAGALTTAERVLLSLDLTDSGPWCDLDRAVLLGLTARVARLGGRDIEARAALTRAAAIVPFGTHGIEALANLLLPGPNYLARLADLVRLAQPANYLEIGVATGRSLAIGAAGRPAIAIDPAPLPAPLPDGCRYFQMTSDAFFASQDPTALLGQRPLALAFIDGLHQWDQVLRDLRNVERHAAAGSLVVLHDSLPPSPLAATREQRPGFWTGDVWRAVVALADLRPALRLATLACAPSGLTLLRGLDPAQAGDERLWQGLAAQAEALPIMEFEALAARVKAVPNSNESLDRFLAG